LDQSFDKIGSLTQSEKDRWFIPQRLLSKFITGWIGSGPGVGLNEPDGCSGVFARHWKVKVDGLDPAKSRRSALRRIAAVAGTCWSERS